jgi:hypothetical protein
MATSANTFTSECFASRSSLGLCPTPAIELTVRRSRPRDTLDFVCVSWPATSRCLRLTAAPMQLAAPLRWHSSDGSSSSSSSRYPNSLLSLIIKLNSTPNKSIDVRIIGPTDRTIEPSHRRPSVTAQSMADNDQTR